MLFVDLLNHTEIAINFSPGYDPPSFVVILWTYCIIIHKSVPSLKSYQSWWAIPACHGTNSTKPWPGEAAFCWMGSTAEVSGPKIALNSNGYSDSNLKCWLDMRNIFRAAHYSYKIALELLSLLSVEEALVHCRFFLGAESLVHF